MRKLGAIMVGAVFLLSACSSSPEPLPAPTALPAVSVPEELKDDAQQVELAQMELERFLTANRQAAETDYAQDERARAYLSDSIPAQNDYLELVQGDTWFSRAEEVDKPVISAQVASFSTQPHRPGNLAGLTFEVCYQGPNCVAVTLSKKSADNWKVSAIKLQS